MPPISWWQNQQVTPVYIKHTAIQTGASAFPGEIGEMTELPARGPWSPRGCGNHKLVLGEIKSAGFFLSSMITFFLNMNQVVLSAQAWTFTNRETSRDVPKSVPKRSENSVVDQSKKWENIRQKQKQMVIMRFILEATRKRPILLFMKNLPIYTHSTSQHILMKSKAIAYT